MSQRTLDDVPSRTSTGLPVQLASTAATSCTVTTSRSKVPATRASSSSSWTRLNPADLGEHATRELGDAREVAGPAA